MRHNSFGGFLVSHTEIKKPEVNNNEILPAIPEVATDLVTSTEFSTSLKEINSKEKIKVEKQNLYY
jgi:hypothetical protein